MKSKKQWFDINPLEVMTPNGTQMVERIHFNGYEPTLHLKFKNNLEESYEMDCTFNHPLRTVDGEWIEAECIETHHKFDNGYSLVSSLVNAEEIPTFDFEVPEEHCYILESGIVSHNTALLMGGVSESWFPDPGAVFDAGSSVGELRRITPVIYELMKSRGVYNPATISDIIDNLGSVQHVNWLTDEEKVVFLNAFEMDQRILFRHATQRQKYTCQGQSLNFYVPEDGSEDLISELMTMVLLHEDCLSQYYIYSRSGVVIKDECISCQA